MKDGDKLSFANVKRRIGAYLETALNIEEFSITFAALCGEVWKVNVVFIEKSHSIEWVAIALFSINATTGKLKEFEKGRWWKFDTVG